MNFRRINRGFTLVEMLVVIGIITILIAVLVPMVRKEVINSDIQAQKFDFQTIEAAIGNYKADFGVIPQNISQPQAPHNSSGTTPVIRLYSLATALLGPGPAVTQSQTINGQTFVTAGDGADGDGFRTISQPFVTAATAASAGGSSVTVAALPQSWYNPTTSQYQWPIGPNGSPIPVYVTLSPSMYEEESVGVYTGPPGTPSTPTTTLPLFSGTQLQYGHTTSNPPYTNTVAVIRTCTGKVWPNYLPEDKFTVIWTKDKAGDTFWTSGSNVPIWPQLADRWGNPIQYFTRFGPISNRLNDSYTGTTSTAAPSGVIVKAGPLMGVSTPGSLDTIAGARDDTEMDNAIWDMRDSSLFGSTAYPISNPAFGATYDPFIAIRWMLGDDPISMISFPTATSTISGNDNFISTSEKVFDGDYFLLSVGPIQSDSGMMGFANFYGIPGNQWQSTLTASGNVYSFDKP
ncbi:MAG: type II secretion system protein [Tepidisphaeraceae bacterium]|jgi:prepilin-type N-terminal cleavage/methylation domain-containing protein